MKHLARIVALLALLITPALSVSAQTPVATTGGSGAFAPGIDAPATFFDDRGNAVIEMTVTGVERDWQEYDEFSAPERGMVYVKIDFSFTNVSNRAEIVSPYTIILVDSKGLAAQQGYFSDNTEILTEDVPIAPGETVTGSLVFSLYSDLDPAMIVWQPDYNLYVFVYLGD